MVNNYTETRIGTLLVNKGLISREQLNTAIDEQQKRKQRQLETGPSSTMQTSTVIGEILVDLGFITSRQLKLTLTKQKLLRKVAFALTVTAPLLTGCGGGGGSDSASSESSHSVEASTSVDNPGVSDSETVIDSGSQFTLISKSSPESSSPEGLTTLGVIDPDDDTSLSPIVIAPITPPASDLETITEPTPSPEDDLETITESPEVEDDELTVVETEDEESAEEDLEVIVEAPDPEEDLDPIAAEGNGEITINWGAPSTRENGDPLDLSDIAGYQILLENLDTGTFQYIYVSEADITSTSYTIQNLADGSYQVSIAIVDQDGLYSDFTTPLAKDIAA